MLFVFSVNIARSINEDQVSRKKGRLVTPFLRLSLERTVSQVPATLSTVSTLRVTTVVNRSRTLSNFAQAFCIAKDGGEADKSSVIASD